MIVFELEFKDSVRVLRLKKMGTDSSGYDYIGLVLRDKEAYGDNTLYFSPCSGHRLSEEEMSVIIGMMGELRKDR